MIMGQKTCERAYQRGQAGPYQIRSNAGRLLYSAQHIEAVEFRLYEGRNRVLWRRYNDFGRVVWMAKS